MTQRITQDPDPCAAGAKVTFCYDIEGASLPVDLEVSWDPSGTSSHHTVTGSGDRCWTTTSPNDAEGGLIIDSTSQSDDFAIFVSP